VFGLPDTDREHLRDLLARLLDAGPDHACP
jgi:hypothetical protein